LLGEEFYPSTPSRVEYVFGCGCPGGGASCDPRLAGFDVQVNCLAQGLRRSLDDIKANQITDGGWGPGTTKTSLDGAKVTPADEATAALYQLDPRVGAGSAGNWLFWNIWQNYTAYLNYTGGQGTPMGAWIGDPCKSDSVCDFPGGTCATNYPGGLCTAQCTKDCPTLSGRVPTFCAAFNQGGYCLPVCSSSIAGSCRDGYTCQPNVKSFADPSVVSDVCVVP
jgi:hypothetical protein